MTRWFGVGVAAVVAVITLGLGVTGRLTLYISADSVWFACTAAAVTLALAVWSCTLPLASESDHGHDHHDHHDDEASARRSPIANVALAAGGVVVTGTVLAGLILPPASLSTELAMSRAAEGTVLFGDADNAVLGVTDTTEFGVGDWASVFATATRPEAYDGTPVTLSGFVTPAGGDAEGLNLTRMVITHCVIDARPVSVLVDADAGDYADGQWLDVTGVVRADADGVLRIEPTEIAKVDEPEEPYEY